MDLKGKTAIVTGGASGLGAGCVRMLTAAGANAVALDLNAELGEAFAKEIGPSARFVKANVCEEADVKRAIDLARSEFGRLDIAINCAGIGGSKRTIGKEGAKEGAVELSWFTTIIQVNLVGTFNVARLAAAAMAANEPGEDGERGVIINTASIAAYDGQIGQTAYAASKGGIVGLTLPLARDLARHGIRVVTIAPGIFDTPLLGRLPENVRKALSDSVPFPQRLGLPEDYASLAREIIANGMLNGEVIRLDGALRMAPK